MTTRLLLAAALTIAAPAAFAQVSQSQTQLSPSAAQSIPRIHHVPTGALMPDLPGEALADRSVAFSRSVVASPARVERAERLAELINSGQCGEASAIAREAGDRRMIRRIEAVCARKQLTNANESTS